MFLFNLNELGIGEGTQANPKCLKNLKVIKKPSMVTLTSLVFATVQFSFESKYQSNSFPFSYIWCTVGSLADNPELLHLSYLFACKDALVLAPMPLNVGLNYVKEKSSGCLPSLLRHGGKYKDILLRSHQLLSLTSPVPYIAFHLSMILCCFSHFLCYFPWHICRWIYLFLNFPAFPHLANRAVNELLSWC